MTVRQHSWGIVLFGRKDKQGKEENGKDSHLAGSTVIIKLLVGRPRQSQNQALGTKHGHIERLRDTGKLLDTRVREGQGESQSQGQI
jgi:hypothetical protein